MRSTVEGLKDKVHHLVAGAVSPRHIKVRIVEGQRVVLTINGRVNRQFIGKNADDVYRQVLQANL